MVFGWSECHNSGTYSRWSFGQSFTRLHCSRDGACSSSFPGTETFCLVTYVCLCSFEWVFMHIHACVTRFRGVGVDILLLVLRGPHHGDGWLRFKEPPFTFFSRYSHRLLLDIRPLLFSSFLLSLVSHSRLLISRHYHAAAVHTFIYLLALPLSAYILSIKSPSPAPPRSPYNTDLRGNIHVYKPPSPAEARHYRCYNPSVLFHSRVRLVSTVPARHSHSLVKSLRNAVV